MSITPRERREPTVTAVQRLSKLLLAFQAVKEFAQDFPREMVEARQCFSDYERELTHLLGDEDA